MGSLRVQVPSKQRPLVFRFACWCNDWVVSVFSRELELGGGGPERGEGRAGKHLWK